MLVQGRLEDQREDDAYRKEFYAKINHTGTEVVGRNPILDPNMDHKYFSREEAAQVSRQQMQLEAAANQRISGCVFPLNHTLVIRTITRL